MEPQIRVRMGGSGLGNAGIFAPGPAKRQGIRHRLPWQACGIRLDVGVAVADHSEDGNRVVVPYTNLEFMIS
jgi:hypothetical protein